MAAHPTTIILDELAHTNLPGGRNAKRWQDAMTLREAGISVIGALNVQHIETVAPVAERAIGFPIREIVPLSFLQAADQVIALDAPPDLIEARLRSGKIVGQNDIERALAGSFKPQTLQIMRELMLRTLDDLTDPVLRPVKVSALLALPIGLDDPCHLLTQVRRSRGRERSFIRGCALAETGVGDKIEKAARVANARIVPPLPQAGTRLPIGQCRRNDCRDSEWRASKRDCVRRHRPALYIAGSQRPHVYGTGPSSRTSSVRANRRRPPAHRLRPLTVYLGASQVAAKPMRCWTARTNENRRCGRGRGLVETHNRTDTVRMLDGLDCSAKKRRIRS